MVMGADLALMQSTKYMEYQLAQVNIGRILGPLDSDVMAEFAAGLDPINALAEASKGFVWRLKDENNNATSIAVTDDRFLLVNLSVWRTMADLYAFTYKSAHTEYVRRRAEWFERMKELFFCCWYVPAGHEPTVEEAMERIAYIRQHGPTAVAFTFKKPFTLEEAKASGFLS
jgi:hypothetical protein